jgi:alkanesulfonate monooxygenase SsuD/methylene tetrahydromethanopterin reductase-like flavin-dependent oxidoreductase (luciferase family)
MKKTGLVLSRTTPKETIKAIIEADKKGVETVWAISGGLMPDLLTYYAAAAVQTKQITFGTSILQILPRHPNIMIAQALVLENLAPGRLKLGIGPSHKYSMEHMLGLSFDHHMGKLKEYVQILRSALWKGRVDFSGEYYTMHDLSLPLSFTPPRTPIFISALREKAFELAGEIADGAISWMCPVEYLLETAKPALRKGAKAKDRSVPSLIAHIPVAFSTNSQKVVDASHKQLDRYGKMPFYARMFEDAGFPVETNGDLSEGFIKNFVVYGTASEIRKQLDDILKRGIDELLILPVIIDDQIKEELAILDIIGS